MDKSVIRRTVGDAEMLGSVGPNANSAEREHAGLDRRCVQPVEQRIELKTLLDIGGIFDDQVRHTGRWP